MRVGTSKAAAILREENKATLAIAAVAVAPVIAPALADDSHVTPNASVSRMKAYQTTVVERGGLVGLYFSRSMAAAKGVTFKLRSVSVQFWYNCRN